jgi:hypothetical protein
MVGDQIIESGILPRDVKARMTFTIEGAAQLVMRTKLKP